MPLNLHYSNWEDSSKLLYFDLPKGKNTVAIFVKTKTKDFFPTVYSHIVNGNNKQIIFPPEGEIKYSTYVESDWDCQMNVLRFMWEGVSEGVGSGIALNIVYKKKFASEREVPGPNEDTSAMAMVIVSSTPI